MFTTPRTYRLSEVSDEGASPEPLYHRFLATSLGWGVKSVEAQKAAQMLLVHQVGSLHVGEVVRYTVTYARSQDRILPTPSELWVKVRNTSAIPLRAAYLHGPYTLYVSCHPAGFDPNEKKTYEGVPQFEPNVRAGGSWDAVIPIPPPDTTGSTTLGDVEWIIEISSQILFSTSAEVPFELLVGRNEKATELGTTTRAGLPPPGELKDHIRRHFQGVDDNVETKAGVYSSAVRLKVDDTTSLWKSPNFPSYHEKYLILTGQKQEHHSNIETDSSSSSHSEDNPELKNVHLVVITHGLHSNVGADMLYVKESIERVTKASRERARTRQSEDRSFASSTGSPGRHPRAGDGAHDTRDTTKSPSATGSEQQSPEFDSDINEEVVVCGFPGNVVRTERGIQYLGKRLAKYVLLMTYPDQPYLPERMSHSRHTLPFARQTPDPIPQEVRKQFEELQKKYGYKITKISFIGHSLGGLIQMSALAYIQDHSPEFFDRIKPVNFIALASPFLGLSHENPLYVRFALDFGLVGRTGQDLGLAWRAPTRVKSGWEAMIGGSGSDQAHSRAHMEASSKPLLRILPAGTAHEVLKQFERRTIYANVVNDGIVPLRTSSLLFLDWRGLQRVTKARRENGPVGTMAEWGWAELTGSSATAMRQKALAESRKESRKSSEYSPDSATIQRTSTAAEESAVTQSSNSVSDQKDTTSTWTKTFLTPSNPLSSLLAFFRFHSRHPQSKKATKIFNRSQTLQPTVTTEIARPSFANDHSSHTAERLVEQVSQESHRHLPTHSESTPCLPPRTTLLEAAGDVLNPPIPSNEFIMDPQSRPETIFHDRMYHPSDIPPPPPAKARTFFGTSRSHTTTSSEYSTQNGTNDSNSEEVPKKPSGMEVEEKIARAYHAELSWRKVLVRLEPDAHNNIIVRRMFSNAYGWPVIAHLVENHFAETVPEESYGRDHLPSRSSTIPQQISRDMAISESSDAGSVTYASPQRRMTDPGLARGVHRVDTRRTAHTLEEGHEASPNDVT